MSTPEVERQLAAVLHRHAEDAMNRTNTQTELEKLHAGVDAKSRRDHRRWVIGGLAAAAAAAAIAFGLGTTDLGDDRSNPDPAEPGQTAEEEVAQGFVDAYTSGDADRAASYLAPGATPWQGWRGDIRVDEAWSREYIVHPCQELGSSPAGTRVGCLFDYHVWHSEQLGLGPFGNNSVTILVNDGKVVSVVVSYSSPGNGQSELFEAIGAWVRENHPGDWAFMANTEGHTRVEMQQWYQLWKEYSQEYADAKTLE